MAATRVQTKSGNAGSYTESCAITWDSNTTTGNTIIVIIGVDQSDKDVISVTDSQSNTYTRIHTGAGSSNGAEYFMYYAYNITGGTTPTVTVNITAGNSQDIVVLAREYSGLTTTDPLDVNTFTSEGSYLQTHTSGTTGSTTTTNQLVVMGMVADAKTPTYSAGSGYSNLSSQGGFDLYLSVAIQDKDITSTGTQSGSFSTTSFTKGSVGIATLKEASAPTSGPSRLTLLGVG